MQWLTLHVVSANIVRCEKRTRANFTYQPFSAQVTKMLISSGEMIVQRCSEVLVIERSQDWGMAGEGVRERVVFLVFEIFFSHTGIDSVNMSGEKWNGYKSRVSQRSLNSCKGFNADTSFDFAIPHTSLRDALYQQKETFTFTESYKCLIFLISAVQRNPDLQDGSKYVVTTAMLLNDCQHRRAVFAGSAGFL